MKTGKNVLRFFDKMSLEKINGYEKEPENRKFGKENIKQ
jgi:hypothetical protein